MMRCQFSEMQFVFGVLREIVQKLNPANGWTSIQIPTQREELEVGYDCRLGRGAVRALFFQFKVPQKLTRSNAKHWRDFGGDYYNFKLWKTEETPQHNNLVKLANKDHINRVFYCAPAFIEEKEFQIYYEKEEIAKNSIYISCKDLPIIPKGDERHSISYRIFPSRVHKMYSEPVEIKGMTLEEVLCLAQQSDPYDGLEDFVSQLSRNVGLDLGHPESVQERLWAIARHLLVRYNLSLVLF